MAIGIIGRKCGMTRVFTEDGSSVPVTVIEVSPNRVTQVKTKSIDGYRAVQITVGVRRASRVNKAAAGHYAKAGVEAGRGLWEFRLDDSEGEELSAGGTDCAGSLAGGAQGYHCGLACRWGRGIQAVSLCHPAASGRAVDGGFGAAHNRGVQGV